MTLAWQKKRTLITLLSLQGALLLGVSAGLLWLMPGVSRILFLGVLALLFGGTSSLGAILYFHWLKTYRQYWISRGRFSRQKSWYIREVVIHLNNLLFNIEKREDLFHEIIEKALETIPGADHGSMMIKRSSGILDFTAAVGFDLAALSHVHLKVEDTYLSRMTEGRCHRPVIISNKQNMDEDHQNPEIVNTLSRIGSYDYNSTLTAPIVVDGGLFGILNVDSDRVDAFTEEDVVMMEYFTNQIGVAIKNHDLMEKALKQSRIDGLTKLYNRQYFEELLQLVMKQNQRKGEGFQLIMFDLNDFKPVNDSYGHSVGDDLIRLFAQTLRDSIRGSDLVGRLGGDEFVAAFFYTTPGEVHRKMEELRADLAKQPVKAGGDELTVCFSYGLASCPEEGSTFKELMTLADKRMYVNKEKMKAGR